MICGSCTIAACAALRGSAGRQDRTADVLLLLTEPSGSICSCHSSGMFALSRSSSGEWLQQAGMSQQGNDTPTVSLRTQALRGYCRASAMSGQSAYGKCRQCAATHTHTHSTTSPCDTRTDMKQMQTEPGQATVICTRTAPAITAQQVRQAMLCYAMRT
jgi:hypothetical protein